MKIYVSLKALYEAGITKLCTGDIIRKSDDYYDLYDTSNDLLLMDGEAVTIIENIPNKRVCALSEDGKQVNFSQNEFNIAVFN